jgi:hypothetical protein
MDRMTQKGQLLIYLVRMNGKPVYVGQVYGEKQSVARRWRQHQKGPHHGRKLFEVIQMMSLAPFTVEIIDEAKDREELNLKEVQHVKTFDTYLNGFNGNEGGSATFARNRKPHSEEAKARMRVAALGRHHDEETKRLIGEASKGNQYVLGMKFGPRTEEVKKKLREALVGVEHTEERKANQAAAAKNRFADPAKKAAWYEKRWGKKKELVEA